MQTTSSDANASAPVEVFPRACPVCLCDDKRDVFAPPNVDLHQWRNYSFSSRKQPENAHFGLIVCPKCDLLYSDPIPSLDVLTRSYQESSFDSGREAFYASRTYAKIAANFFKQLPDRDNALDVGTGEGSFLERLIEAGFRNVTGNEPSRAPIAAAKESIRPRIREGVFRAADFQEGSFSLITCFQTFEHLYDPAGVCRDFYRLLKSGGGVFLVMHNRLALSARALGFKSPIFDVEHLQLFSPKSASYLLKQCGFRNIETRAVMNRYPLWYWARLFPFPRAIKSSLLEWLERSPVGRVPISLPAGNFAAFAIKP